MGLASGATVIIAQYFGSGDEERLSRAEHTVLSFCLLAGLVMTLGGWLSADWTLRLVNTPADILEASGRYLKIFYLGTVPLLLFKSAGVGDFVPGTDVVLVNRRKGYTCELLSRAEGSDLLFYAKATRRGFLVVIR